MVSITYTYTCPNNIYIYTFVPVHLAHHGPAIFSTLSPFLVHGFSPISDGHRHGQALMRLEAFKLGCRILRDPNVALQEVGLERHGWF